MVLSSSMTQELGLYIHEHFCNEVLGLHCLCACTACRNVGTVIILWYIHTIILLLSDIRLELLVMHSYPFGTAWWATVWRRFKSIARLNCVWIHAREYTWLSMYVFRHVRMMHTCLVACMDQTDHAVWQTPFSSVLYIVQGVVSLSGAGHIATHMQLYSEYIYLAKSHHPYPLIDQSTFPSSPLLYNRLLKLLYWPKAWIDDTNQVLQRVCLYDQQVEIEALRSMTLMKDNRRTTHGREISSCMCSSLLVWPNRCLLYSNVLGIEFQRRLWMYM